MDSDISIVEEHCNLHQTQRQFHLALALLLLFYMFQIVFFCHEAITASLIRLIIGTSQKWLHLTFFNY